MKRSEIGFFGVFTCVFAFLIYMLLCVFGYSAINNETTGQVKKIVNNTPIICPNYKSVNIAIGSMQSGAITTTHDWYVINKEQADILKYAAENQKLVKIIYNTKRMVFCADTHYFIESVDILESN